MSGYNITRRGFLQGFLVGISGLTHAPAILYKTSPAKAQQTILFLGDSITRAGGYVRIIADALEKESPENPPRIINAGKSSETVSGLSEAYHPGVRPTLFSRLHEELEVAKPDWVVACYGINCGIYHPFSEDRFAAYKAGIKKLIERVYTHGSRLILLTAPPYAKPGPPFPAGTTAADYKRLLKKANEDAQIEAANNPERFGYRTPYAYYDHVLEQYAQWLITLDNHEDVWVVNLRTAMMSRLSESYDEDPIHPNATGHLIMAQQFLDAWPRILESIG